MILFLLCGFRIIDLGVLDLGLRVKIVEVYKYLAGVLNTISRP